MFFLYVQIFVLLLLEYSSGYGQKQNNKCTVHLISTNINNFFLILIYLPTICEKTTL